GGVGTFSATLRAAGNRTLAATDIANRWLTETSDPIVITAAVATHFSVTAPASAATNVGFVFTVTARDASNNVVSDYGGTVHFTARDSFVQRVAVLPANSTLSAGVGTFSGALEAIASEFQTITATDTVTSSISGTSPAINVAPGPVTHFQIIIEPPSTTSGS